MQGFVSKALKGSSLRKAVSLYRTVQYEFRHVNGTCIEILIDNNDISDRSNSLE